MTWTAIWAVVSSLIGSLLAGVNIFQIITIRELKAKAQAEAELADAKADQEQNQSLLQIIAGQSAEIARLQTAYADLQAKYFEMAAEVQAIKSGRKE